MTNTASAVRTLRRAGFAGHVPPAGCPSRSVLDHVTSKWGVLILIALSQDTLRWSELRRTVSGITEKMLAQTLRVLESDGFVHRDAQPSIPPRVHYSLTARGLSLTATLLPLMDWITEHADQIVAGRRPVQGLQAGAGANPLR